jgi:thiamine-monophosphate kinase
LSHTTVSSLGEHSLIARITERLAMPPWVVVGPGDDAAVLQPERGTADVLTTDALVDGVHFDLRFVAPPDVGHRALAVNLSDLAAMGAEPRAALLSLLLPASLDVATLDGIIDGMTALAAQHRVAIVGGNITQTPGPLAIDVTAVGSVHPRRVLRRSGARPGDDVYVTGTLGDAAVGLRWLLEGGDPQSEMYASCIERYRRPEPRVRAGLLLGRNRVASSCMDLSDGLADAVRQVARASAVGITIDETAIPISPAARSWHEAARRNAIATAMTGGDDYELLFTVRPAYRGRLRGVLKMPRMAPVTRIGVVTKEPGLLVRGAHGISELPLGYEHFRFDRDAASASRP